ncbi:hypothetical protein OVA24_03880 [Luteolibacter sp. SL250]|uniref:hypothetical protein n=1 Tax=Luteolibacter sp. SL250 TaxID=2995170 RepID=UPI00226E0E6A|nr:hypothetical protein [Luteolibacter sp. SL250]WAC20517.1 hypothetical protein OVA24_03880 [Luteolibacter sp. SL250]
MPELARRFDALDRRGKSIPWRRIYLILSLMVCGGLAFWIDRLIETERESLNSVKGMGAGLTLFPESSLADLTPEEWLLLGDGSKPLLEQKKELWDSAPENPAFFAEYAVAYHSQHKTLPPDYFETATRLDPDNAWFDYYGAAVTGYKSVKKLPNDEEDKKRKRAHRYEIRNRETYGQALEIIRRAGDKPNYNSYEREMISRRVALLPQSTLQEKLASTAYLVGMKHASIVILLDLSGTFCARLDELEQAGDADGFREFAGEGRAYILKLVRDGEFNMVNELTVHVSVAAISRHVTERAVDMSIAGEFPWAAEWYEVLEKQRLERSDRSEERKGKVSVADRKGGFLAMLYVPSALERFPDSQPIKEEEFKPSRLHDYSWLSMIGSGGLRLFIAGVGVGFLLYRFRASSLVRVMSRRVEWLLSPMDWLWIIAGGVVLPVGLVYSLMFFTPLGSWDTSVRRTASVLYLVQPIPAFLALGSLMIIVPVLVVRWRLRRKAGALGFRGGDGAGWLAVGGLLIFATSYKHVWPYQVSYGAGALALLWLLLVAGRAVFSGPPRLLSRVVISRVMLPVCATGVLVAHVSIFGFQKARQYWLERDELMKFSADEPGLSKHEYRLAHQMRTGLRQLVDKHR